MPPALPGLLGHDQTSSDPQWRFPLPVHHLPGVLPQPLRHAEAHEGPQTRGDPHRLADREDLSLPLLRLREEAEGQQGQVADAWAKNPTEPAASMALSVFSSHSFLLARRILQLMPEQGTYRPLPQPHPHCCPSCSCACCPFTLAAGQISPFATPSQALHHPWHWPLVLLGRPCRKEVLP